MAGNAASPYHHLSVAELAGAQAPVDVARWEIPVVVDGVPQLLSGAIRWLPNGQGAAGSSGTAVALVGGVALLVLVVAGGVVLVLRARRLADASAVGNEGSAEHEHQPMP